MYTYLISNIYKREPPMRGYFYGNTGAKPGGREFPWLQPSQILLMARGGQGREGKGNSHDCTIPDNIDGAERPRHQGMQGGKGIPTIATFLMGLRFRYVTQDPADHFYRLIIHIWNALTALICRYQGIANPMARIALPWGHCKTHGKTGCKVHGILHGLLATEVRTTVSSYSARSRTARTFVIESARVYSESFNSCNRLTRLNIENELDRSRETREENGG